MTDLTLQHLTGPRTYFAPPHQIIVKTQKADRTKAGLHTPGQRPAMGVVVAVGDSAGGGMLASSDPPCNVGDTVLFDPEAPVPIRQLHDDYAIMDWGIVTLVIRMGKVPGGLYYEPEGGAEKNGAPAKLGLLRAVEGEDGD